MHLFHKWGLWSKVYDQPLTYHDKWTGQLLYKCVERRQARKCQKCGKCKVRKVNS